MPELNPPTRSDDSHRIAKRSIVIGGGIAGLLAAKVLADHFEQVTILERDNLSDPNATRNGAPQRRHIHVLWSGGANVIERLFPGILEELVTGGSVALDACNDLRWFHHGVWKMQLPSSIVMHAQTRSFLEENVRRRLAANPRVSFLQSSASELCFNANQNRVTGVRTELRDGGAGNQDLAADLVVDASGRGSRTPRFLEAIGYRKLPESTVGIDLAYSSRVFHIPANAPKDCKVLAVFAKAPDSRRYGVLAPIEGQRWIVTLAGCLGDHPPADEKGFMAFAKQLDQPDLHDAILHAEPAAPIATYRFPTQLRRHYEEIIRFPDGLVVLGDALCSFNPLYGQGMTVCAQEAILLSELLRSSSYRAEDGFAGLPQQFFRRAKRIVDNPWLLASCTDFLYPGTTGRRPFGTKLLGWYITKLLQLSESNQSILTRFYEVLHFLKPPTALFHPYVVGQVLMHGLRSRKPPESA